MARTLRSVAKRIARAWAELEVPRSSIELIGMLAYAVSTGDVDPAEAKQWAQAIAAPMVAAELRRVAKVIRLSEGSHRWMYADGLDRRADELDGCVVSWWRSADPFERNVKDAVPCPRCGAPVGRRCHPLGQSTGSTHPHAARVQAWTDKEGGKS